MYFINVIKSYRDIVAICDKEILGKIFEDEKFQINVKENFYKGKEANEEEVRRIINDMVREDATFNIVGKNSVKIALEEGIISQEGIKEIQGVPVALVLL
ncbi:MAG: DUF424 family protein [Candidatus Pacearchaeota archaeon]|nr:DUF424 family protein [Candidatus Pacearchaeota archaeon]